MTRAPYQSLLRSCLLSAAALASLPVTAQEADRAAPTLPTWQVLEYEQKAYFVTARSRVEIIPDTADDTHWHLTARSSVASNFEDVTLKMSAGDGAALHRSRLSKGKQERYKTYDFLPRHILRVRHDPTPKTTLPPAQWPVSSRHKIPYPPAAKGMIVTDAYALLELTRRFLASNDASAELVINTEFNFYRVRMSQTDDTSIKVNYQVAGSPEPISGKQQARAVRVEVSPMGELAEKSDFSLLGLKSDITVLFDPDGKVPLQLRGEAPRIGKTEINLKILTPREATE